MAAVIAVGRAAGLEPREPIADVRAGDLYERHAPRVYAYCRSRLSRREDAEDALQTTFLHAVNGLRSGVTPAHELAWLLGIARNVCLTRVESAGRRGRLELVCDPVDLERSAAPRSRRDELIGLELALAQLPEQQRRAVLLRDWRGLSYEEVAAQLGVSLANAETLIFRGRRTLAELLREEQSSTRYRLGLFGLLFSWTKSVLTGAAAASKVAAAAAVVVVSGVGGGVSALETERQPRAPATVATDAQPARTPAALDPPTRGPSPRPAPVSKRAEAPPRAPTRAAGEPERPDPVAPAPATPPPETTAPQPTPAMPESRAPAPIRSAVDEVQSNAETTVPALAPVTEPIVDAVGALPVPQLPVAKPPLDETLADVLPPVAAPPHAVAPIPVAPSNLLQ